MILSHHPSANLNYLHENNKINYNLQFNRIIIIVLFYFFNKISAELLEHNKSLKTPVFPVTIIIIFFSIIQSLVSCPSWIIRRIIRDILVLFWQNLYGLFKIHNTSILYTLKNNSNTCFYMKLFSNNFFSTNNIIYCSFISSTNIYSHTRILALWLFVPQRMPPSHDQWFMSCRRFKKK